MSFKHFEKELPEMYSLADQAERTLDFDHVIALNHLKQIGRMLVTNILRNEKMEPQQKDPFINLEALMEIEVLPVHMETALKQLEYLDSRESAMFIAKSHIHKLLIDIYDLISWYYKTYIDDQFTPLPLLLKSQVSTLLNPLNPLTETETPPGIRKSILHIDHNQVEGEWEDSKENVHVIESGPNETYQGQISNGMKNGTGVFRWADGSRYEGNWFNDNEYGYGVKEYANGDRYLGEWRDGLFHGKGTYMWGDGTVFEGGWQDNLEHGYGIKIDKDGKIQKGYWTLGELVFTEVQLGQPSKRANRSLLDT